MMRSLSTSALGQPSETKLTFGARRASAVGSACAGSSCTMAGGLADRAGGGKRAVGSGWVRQADGGRLGEAERDCLQSPAPSPIQGPVGRVAEWFKAAVLKTARGFTLPRGFESHPFRQPRSATVDPAIETLILSVC